MTNIYCTKCGKELCPEDEIVVTVWGTVKPCRDIAYLPVDGNYIELGDDPSAYEDMFCKECFMRANRPNRVVVGLGGELLVDSTIEAIRAEHPDKVHVMVKDYLGAVGYGPGGSRPIKLLNTVMLTDEEIEARWEEQKAWSEEKKDLYYTGMGG